MQDRWEACGTWTRQAWRSCPWRSCGGSARSAREVKRNLLAQVRLFSRAGRNVHSAPGQRAPARDCHDVHFERLDQLRDISGDEGAGRGEKTARTLACCVGCGVELCCAACFKAIAEEFQLLRIVRASAHWDVPASPHRQNTNGHAVGVIRLQVAYGKVRRSTSRASRKTCLTRSVSTAP